MLIYILKFSACLSIFLVFYKLFLEKENMHQFKRFYLIGAVLIAIGIPLITITQYVEPLNVISDFSTSPQLLADNSSSNENIINYLPSILWGIYALGVLLFGLKFGFNLFQIIFKIKRNPKLRTNNFINVLLKDLITPHTFFSYIFLNKSKYENQEIPQEVLLHEQTHANQKHSIDILLIEIMQVIFWFNPLIYLTKKSIKLNHEFLADKAVLNNGIQAKNYQHILLAFSINQREPQLANAINYSSIKKRFTVMKTQTSKQKVWFRSLILLPLLALTLYSFSDKIEIIKEANQIDLLQQNNSELSDKMTSQVISEIQDGASREQMKEYERLAKHYNSQPKKQRIIKQKDIVRMKYIYGLMNDKQKKDTEPFPNIPPPPAPPVSKAPQPIKIEVAPPPPLRQNATDAEKKRYYEAMKQYKLRAEKVKHVENIERLKTEKMAYQEARAAKLKTEKLGHKEARVAKLITEKGELVQVRELQEKERVLKLKEEKLVYKEARAAKLKTEKVERVQVRELQTKERKLKLKEKKIALNEVQKAKLSTQERIQVREIKTPKPPKSPLDHVIDMAKKGAKFYLEGKEISSDKAISVVKANKKMNISTKRKDSKWPKVYLSTKPIVIED